MPFLLSFFLTKSYSQLAKGNWLVGGNGNFSIIKVLDETTHYLQLSPNIGYFCSEKFAAGLKLRYVNNVGKSKGTNSIAKTFGFYFGPFVRYYFLSTGKPYSILLEANCQHGWKKKWTVIQQRIIHLTISRLLLALQFISLQA